MSSAEQIDVGEAALTFRDVHKTFRTGLRFSKVHAVRGVSLRVRRGEIFGYLGPNGAGKTTSMKMALGLIRPTQGHIELLGEPSWKAGARAKVGYAPEHPYFYDFLTPVELLHFYGRIFGLAKSTIATRTEELLATVGLESARNRRLRGFSKGMLQRTSIAQALIGDPELVVLDEPLSGLDPMGRKELREVIVGLRQKGTTVFVSSHILHDLELICDRVAIIVDGRVEREGVLHELLHADVADVDVEVRELSGESRARFEEDFPVVDLGSALLMKVPSTRIDEILSAILAAGGKVVQVTPRRLSLEELFVQEASRE